MFNPMLNRSTAAENASRHLAELVPLAGSPVLEEHFLHEGIWQITLSYFPASPHANGSATREYKSFAIDGRTGEVLSMKIRNPKA
jgi:hypothetical protein